MLAPDKPFFLYYAPGACHAPHHAPEGVDRPLQGPLRHGLRGDARADPRAPEGDGHRPARHRAAAAEPDRHARDPHRAERRAVPGAGLHAAVGLAVGGRAAAVRRMAEVYAGFLAHADEQIGRLLDYLEETGQRENTIVILVSDNGASGEGGPNGSVNENKFFNGMPDDIDREPGDARRPRRPQDLQPLPQRLGDGVQHAVQDVEALRVQRRHARTRASSPGRRASRPAASSASSTTTPIDLVPTILDALGVEPPETIGGHVQSRFDGVSMRYSFDAAPLPSARETQFYSMLGSRSIWHDGWKAVTTHPTISGWGNFDKDTWELYHTDVDRSELHDLAAAEPERLQELVNLWYAEAGANGAFPLDDRGALEIILTPRPRALAGAQPLRLLPRPRRRARVPGGQHPQPLLRDRRARRHPRPRRRGRAVRARLALRRPRPLRQGQPAALRLQLRRQPRAEDRRRAGAAEPARA